MQPEVKLKITAIDDTKAAFRSVERGIGNVEQATASFRSRLNDLQPAFRNMVAYGGVALGAIGYGANRAITAASDLEESINAVSVVFGEGAEDILAFGQNAAQAVGLSTAAFNQMSTVTGALLKDTGLSMEQVANQTNELTVRAADMASVFNTDVSDAMSAINQAIRGETEAIRRYAGDVTDATLQTYLLSQGITTSVTGLSEQEKRLLRVQVIMQQTAVTAGDFANTSDSLANTQRRQAAATENLAAKLGKVLMPIKRELLNLLGPLIDKVAEFTEKHPQLARNIVIVAGAVAGLTVVVGALGIAINVLLSPVTLIIASLAALAAIVYVVATRWEQLPTLFKVVLYPIKHVIEGLQQLYGMFVHVGNAIGWVYEKITGKTISSTLSIQKSFFDLDGALSGFTAALPTQSIAVDDFAGSLSSLGGEADTTADKLKQLREEALGIFETVDEEEANSKRELAEKIVEQEESIADKRKELRELERAEDTAANATRIRQLERTIEDEEDALRTAHDLKLQLVDEIAEAERRASLTAFERQVEDIQRRRMERLKAHVIRLQEIEQEIAAEKAKHGAIASSFGAAQATMQGAIKKTSEVAQQEAEKMKSAFDRAVQSMARLNMAGSPDLAPSRTSRLFRNVDDAVITPKGDVISTHPQDWLIATKNPGELAAAGAHGGQITINITGNSFMGERDMAEKVGDMLIRTLKLNQRV